MTTLTFPLRLGTRTLAAAAVPFLTGSRDQLSHYEKEGLVTPFESLGEFLVGLIEDQGIGDRVEEIQRFLELCIGSTSHLYGGRAWLQLSLTTHEPGLGLAIFNDKRTISQRFFSFLDAGNIAGPAVDLARELCRPFADSAYGQLRAEFRSGQPTRLSVYPGWVLEPFRGHDGFAKLFDKLPPALRDQPIIEHARALAAIQSPELYPYGVGVSLTPDAEAPELKIYTTRFDRRSSPLRGEGCLQSLLRQLGMAHDQLLEVHDLHDRLWQASATKAIQVATSISAEHPEPDRVSLLYCGVDSSAALEAFADAGISADAERCYEQVDRHLGSQRPMYVGVGIGQGGLNQRIKLYEAAFFRDTDVSALERLRPRTRSKAAAPQPPLLLPARQQVPGPGLMAAPGFIYNMARDVFPTMLDLRARYGDVIDLSGVGARNVFFVFGPEGVQRMFRDNSANFVRGANFRNVANVVGNGIVVSEGEFWVRQRKQVSAALTRSVVHTQVDRMVEVIAQMIEVLDGFAVRGEWFDVAHQMREVTRRITLKVMLGIDEDEETTNISKTWEQVYDALTYFTTRPWQPPLSLPIPRYRAFRQAMDAFDERIFQKIAEHRINPKAKGDLVRFLLNAHDPASGRPMTERQLRDELVTVTSAGFDTAAVTLAWTCMLLAQNPWAGHRIAQEANEVLGDRLPTREDISKLTFTRLVIHESMRMYPAAWVLTRTCVEEDELCGYRIPAGAMTITSAWVVHRHPGHWERPDQFWPERFTKENSKGRPRASFFPFGDGPRKCPGEPFALAEITAAIALMCQRFVLRLKPDHPIELEPSFTLRPRHGLIMQLERRANPGPNRR
ncbi:cytochrome P450 [Enhygromyxa salina]|uniref:Epi-isozizaene 5-monooxygenase/(E)-beta-farnesene synthase n=1 Tax=Enhygromyxa salina TaxID=215803 RepID=A0A2S9YN16_9BACT|nr:cytochrome P450 [Enhygromyxa salina]PRQ06474.1 Epi-isozizaene 5-monooxygenase/(E)-beta-farnesene synthase [Enhygromyxa salina]